MTNLKSGTDRISDNGIFDDSNMKLIRSSKTIVIGEGDAPSIAPNRFAHALRPSNETITSEALSRIVTGLTTVLEQTQTVKFHISEFSHVMKKSRELGAAAGCHEIGIAARVYTKRELMNLIILLKNLYRKY
ncbi:hypothetical protein [Leptospira borgpetersenii]|uniref:hypothetical protein n=1 Tax=Leptospira borgpetersenii TaxID=174 RepID=UPI0009BEB9F6|nr:hypothetical protein [Leptospira borgpetersenii]MBE8400297.1 hypothetical protein [Leptospira borgpetersenii serovar Tarassovi]MBE8403386.1 hypothetical protein [Leptospira borgpetersenii serovar Tarassovi]MBE8406529.1 hypothetical protein [Leptospira borgpetersenii serovar Tarassovi]MBE8412698.1 hypothetical protein [Leptospira borgpetersenii serovar Tarassovi]MBE8415875.1 hypothetical protein [Leptospira borgpetersenii serovar Tarassovi]